MSNATKIVKAWSLKRAGAGMTLTGTCNGSPVRQPEVKTVRVEAGLVLAQTKDGDIFQLAVS